MRHHGERFRSARAAFEDPDDDNHQWQGRTERFGVETAFRYDEEGLLWLRTAGNMEDVDLFHTVAVLREIQLFGEWIPFLRQSCVIKAQDFARLLAHFTIGVRCCGCKRDCVFRVAACNHALSGGASLFFEGRSLDDDVTEWHGAAVPPRDRSWGMDRMVVRDFYARVQFLSQFSQRCEVVVCVDLRTRLPRAVLDFFMKRLVGLFIWLWRRQSRRRLGPRAVPAPRRHREGSGVLRRVAAARSSSSSARRGLGRRRARGRSGRYRTRRRPRRTANRPLRAAEPVRPMR